MEVAFKADLIIVLPHNSTIISSYTYGTAAWTRAARITILLEDGSEKSYFLKVRRAQRFGDRPVD